jgi:dipeptidyl aminopeptidase/acylaminoacyl peptidase
MKKLSFLFLLLLPGIVVFSQQKKALDHSVYDHWKDLKNPILSPNGQFAAYEIDPQEGDGWVYLYDVQKQQLDSMPRGVKPTFTADGSLLVYRIKPIFDSLRKMQRKKVKKNKLPKDSVGIWNTQTHQTVKLGQIQKVLVPEKGGNWIAALLKKETPNKKNNKDKSKQIEAKKPKGKKALKPEGSKLILLNALTGDSAVFEHVIQLTLSKNGTKCAFVQVPTDTLKRVEIKVFNTITKDTQLIFEAKGTSKNISLDESGNLLAFTYSNDTVKNKAYGLYFTDLKKNKTTLVSGQAFSKLPKDWSVSPFGKIYFNKSGSALYFGTAPKPEPEIKDTLAKDEKVSLDIWNWKDKLLQPQQKVQVKREKKRNYQAVYFIAKNKLVQLANPEMKEIRINPKTKGLYCLGYDDIPYQKMTSWSGHWYRDVYLVNQYLGTRKQILKQIDGQVSLSPNQKFVAWYNIADSSWNAYSIKSGKSINLTNNLGVNFYNELNDIPNEARAYGMAGWTKENKMVVYDAYDLWVLDPSGKTEAKNITHGEGRHQHLRFRYIKLDKEAQYVPKDMLLSAFQTQNKKAGFYALKGGNLQRLLLDDYAYTHPVKAKNTDDILWRKQSFQLYPDVYLSKLDFQHPRKISNTNPQQKDYLWGSVDLVSWITFDGDTMQGMLYKPANFDPNKKYPMLVYFYERYSDRIHRYIAPRPIRSVINFSYYTSNGYLIFVPDIKYSTGYPGASAFNCIISGTQAMANRFSFIDRTRLGMQGQSWGGYQSAYLVTQTNMFKCAQAGAPVSNMTSAYGGIRWGSGMSREFQYEHTQSRIGGTLWDKLPLYMLNSPLFFAPRVQTPLLIMHNDKDNAVPWYQGIEFFNALRRLHKPVWMLSYNGAPHNLSRRADEKDLTRRMQQFFDHFLKDAPEPRWMKEGIPAVNKGKDFGFELE